MAVFRFILIYISFAGIFTVKNCEDKLSASENALRKTVRKPIPCADGMNRRTPSDNFGF
ncbi:MAG: hypothetical protein HC862_08065 [Scytonema sp. RU_4_4]|nr:hypothetical protein [Scytonema sp. RU_4_4]